MARIRSVHPGLFTDEAFASVSPAAQVLVIGIWTEADDFGAFEWKPVTLKMRIMPAHNVDVVALLAELEAANMVRRYEHEGRQYGAVRNFCRYQRPKKPKSVHFMPSEFRTYVASEARGSEPPEDDPPPVPPKSEPPGLEAAEVPKKTEKSPQMEDGGGRKEERTPPLASLAPLPRPPDPRGSRLPDDWALSDAVREWSIAEARAPPDLIEREVAKFRDYWRAKAGKDGRKSDWNAAWRNWLRKAMEDGNGRRNGAGSRPASYLAGVAEFASEVGGSSSPGRRD